jgi:hypothetical protein
MVLAAVRARKHPLCPEEVYSGIAAAGSDREEAEDILVLDTAAMRCPEISTSSHDRGTVKEGVMCSPGPARASPSQSTSIVIA